MKPRKACRWCGGGFERTTARMLGGVGRLLMHSDFCCTDCREVHRLGAAGFAAKYGRPAPARGRA